MLCECFLFVMTVTGLWFYVMESMEFINEELTRGRLVCSQDYMMERDVAYNSGNYDEKWRTLSGFQVLTKRSYCTK